jgi:phosphatidylserine decarboxylase
LVAEVDRHHQGKKSNVKDFHPAIAELATLIDRNTRVHMLFEQMFQQVPKKKPYGDDNDSNNKEKDTEDRDDTNATGKACQIRDSHHLLQVLNYVLHTAPTWNTEIRHRVGLVGLPINAILDWPMGTAAGYAAFLDPDVNRVLKKMLDAWGKFLQSPDSAKVLGQDGKENGNSGWLVGDGLKELTATANTATSGGSPSKYTFEELFHCDPSLPHYGFKSWDNFFTRTFREGARPVAEPDNPKVIVNACESEPYNLATNVKRRDQFWIKGQPYSLVDMLDNDPLTDQFVGGTVYQAFLSALSYHRWHAPVAGKIGKVRIVEGTYYCEPLFEGLGDPDIHEIDAANEATGQGYLTAVATRALIFIEADEKAIGLMCFLAVGMAEVSTCDTTVKEGQHVKKGDELGMFHFGGSTHCLVFRNGVKVSGFPKVETKENISVRSRLAVVS